LRLSALPPNDHHTYGYHRLEVLAALINGLTLSIIAVGIFWEAYLRWGSPEPICCLTNTTAQHTISMLYL
jgi:cobalt-zinc-cadmium efflux system protein